MATVGKSRFQFISLHALMKPRSSFPTLFVGLPSNVCLLVKVSDPLTAKYLLGGQCTKNYRCELFAGKVLQIEYFLPRYQ